MAVQTYIDGNEVTDVVLSGSTTRRLNGIGQATVRIPIQYAIGDAGSRLKVVVNGDIHFHGFVLNISDECGEDSGYTTYEASDPWELWQWRPARDGPASADPGDFSYPSMFTGDDYPATGPQIFEQCLLQSEVDTNPNFGEGPLFISIPSGNFAEGGITLEGAPVDWPMSIAEIASLLTSTGEVDIILTPIDSGVNMAEVAVYNGDYGNDLSGSVIFEYATGAHNVRELRQVNDMSNMCNKLWYYGGPRVGTARDPEGNQHWCWNITGQDLALVEPPGGVSVAIDNEPVGPPWAFDYLGEKIYNSRVTYGVRMEVKILDAASDSCVGKNSFDYERWLYRRLWQEESWIRALPRQLVHVTPIRGTEIGSFDIGDLIGINAGPIVRGGFSGKQRVYEYTTSWDEDGVISLGELLTASDTGTPS